MDSGDKAPPASATDAVLVPSDEMPQDAQRVEELDFNKFVNKAITAQDLLEGMSHMGFQATSMCEAVRIINNMVNTPSPVLKELILGTSSQNPHQFHFTPTSKSIVNSQPEATI